MHLRNPRFTPYQPSTDMVNLCNREEILLFAPLMDILDFTVSLGEWTDLENEQIVTAPAIQPHLSK